MDLGQKAPQIVRAAETPIRAGFGPEFHLFIRRQVAFEGRTHEITQAAAILTFEASEYRGSGFLQRPVQIVDALIELLTEADEFRCRRQTPRLPPRPVP
ncbi:hypothetical protein [Methylobacterium tardum]|uniref:Uncharacterized protein n=1 Tax=Methylobacterium tardum TaxID=374432 RepID=A0AA37WQW8_9HYPH|nr:hypothetical protein [Methylobacterium tardum]URD36582.1 hypothetical protein M6G65_30320 [Methylobacterium tardum]GLS69279.1 hypothetical protein GCM10007890_12920 [Methylobacterium tardum]